MYKENDVKLADEILLEVEKMKKYFKAGMGAQCEKLGFTMPQLVLLHEVFNAPGITLNDLSDKMNLSKSTVSDIVERLQMRNIIRRERPENDRRITMLYVTDNATSYGSLLKEVRHSLLLPLVSKAESDELLRILEGFELLNELINRVNVNRD